MKTIGVFLDLQEAFETVDHNITLEKLDDMDLRGITNELPWQLKANAIGSRKCALVLKK